MLENDYLTLIDNKKLNCSHAEAPTQKRLPQVPLATPLLLEGGFTKVVKEVAIVTG